MGRTQISLLQSASSFGWPIWRKIQSRSDQTGPGVTCFVCYKISKVPSIRFEIFNQVINQEYFKNSLKYTYNPNTAKQMRVKGLTPGPICSLGVLRFKITSFYINPYQTEWDRKRYQGGLLKIYTKGLHLIRYLEVASLIHNQLFFPSPCLDMQTQVKTIYYKDMRNAWTRKRLAFHKLTS